MAKRKYEGNNIARKYDMTVREQRPGESDLAYFRSLAKMADQRLVRLERYVNDKNYRGLTQYAYANAMYDIRALTGNPDAKRFNVVPVKNKDGSINQKSLHAKINAVKRFLESPTSTKQGVTKVYKQRSNTVNRKYGTDFTWQELAAYYDKAANAAMDSQYGSHTMIRVLGAMRRIGDDPDRIEAAAAGDLKISDDAVVDEVARSLFSQGLSYKDFI